MGGRGFMSAARCKNGHYVCDECHSKDGIAAITDYCGRTKSRDSFAIMQVLMRHPSIHMHGSEHHVLVGSALRATYFNSGGQGNRKELLELMALRGSWGNCGAGISTGIFVSLVTGATPKIGA